MKSYYLMNTEFEFYKMNKVIGMNDEGGDDCTTMLMHLIPLNWTLKNGCDVEFKFLSVLTKIFKSLHVRSPGSKSSQEETYTKMKRKRNGSQLTCML